MNPSLKERIASALSGLSEGYDRFFTAPVSLYPLEILRIAIAALLLIQCAMIADHINLFYGEFALTQASLDTFLNTDEYTLDIYTIARYCDYAGIPVGLDSIAQGTAIVYVVSLVGMLVGWRTRLWCVLVWFSHYILMTSAMASTYGVDTYFHFILFYFIWIPLGKALSVDAMYEKKEWTPFTTIGLRLLQLHLCFTYFSAGFGKAQGYMWWNGEAIWQALMLPEYQQFDLSILASHPWLAMALGYATLFLETFYGIFIWIKPIRPYWVLAIMGLHLSIAIFQGLEFFGVTMAMLTLCLFGSPYLIRAARRLSSAFGSIQNNPLAQFRAFHSPSIKRRVP